MEDNNTDKKYVELVDAYEENVKNKETKVNVLL